MAILSRIRYSFPIMSIIRQLLPLVILVAVVAIILRSLLMRRGAAALPVKRRPESSALIQAIEVGDEDRLRELLQSGASANETNNSGETALMVAANFDRGNMADMLLQAGASISASYSGSTPLHYAAETSLDVLKRLIAAGANLNAVDIEGYSPLMLAVYSGDIERVRALLAAGASTAPRSTDGFTALRTAVEEEPDEAIANLLREYGAAE